MIHWTTYAALAIATIGLIISVISFRKADSVKRLDLRLMLRTRVGDIRGKLDGLPEFLEFADKSKKNNAAAAGMIRSGYMQKWDQELEAAKKLTQVLCESLPESGDDFQSLSQKSLEEKIVEVSAIERETEALREKYIDSLENDKQDVSERRREMNMNFRSAQMAEPNK